ncbi:MAG: ATP-binding cassette domain-containing protein [Oscillospiraceae bacterium]
MGLSIDIEKALPGFSLDMELSCSQGITGILGASGSGKSMLLGCIAGLIKPDKGAITLDGRTFFDSVNKINLSPQSRRTGILFQNYALFPHMTISENIGFALSGLPKEEKNARVKQLLQRFHITEYAGRYPTQISGGQQQRAALARALAVEPDILLLDEPFSALDQHLKQSLMKDMLETLKDYQGCVLFVTHNMEEAFRMCERLVIISNGRIETQGAKQALFSRPPTYESAVITGCKNIKKAIRSSEYLLYVPDWGIALKTDMKIECAEGYAGIRANHIHLAESGETENCFQAWIADESEAPFTTTLYLKLNEKPAVKEDYHIQCEIKKEQRALITDPSQPVRIAVDSQYVFFTER